MKRSKLLAVLFAGCLLFACSPTTLTGSWKDPEYTGGALDKVLVVSLSRNESVRRMLEDEFVRQLGEAGVQAVASYTVFTAEQLKERRDEAAYRVKNLGFDQVIVTRLVDQRTEEVTQPGMVGSYGPGYMGGWHGYYRDSWNVVYAPPVTYQVRIATIESRLFEGGKMIWSGLLETEIGGTAMSGKTEKIIRSFVDEVMKNLEKENLL